MNRYSPSVAYRLGLAARRAAIAASFGVIMGIVTRRPWLGFVIALLFLIVSNTYTAWLETEQTREIERRKK